MALESERHRRQQLLARRRGESPSPPASSRQHLSIVDSGARAAVGEGVAPSPPRPGQDGAERPAAPWEARTPGRYRASSHPTHLAKTAAAGGSCRDLERCQPREGRRGFGQPADRRGRRAPAVTPRASGRRGAGGSPAPPLRRWGGGGRRRRGAALAAPPDSQCHLQLGRPVGEITLHTLREGNIGIRSNYVRL